MNAMPADLDLSRRAFGGLLGAAALTGCATTTRSPHPWPMKVARGRASEDLIDRVTVGLRPARRGGFRLEAEALGPKWLIHNYGHYGFGISLSWGSSEMAVDLSPPVAGQAVAVLGCGIMGLSTARILQERGARVTIYSRELPPHTTSNMSGGQWMPFSPTGTDPAYHARFREAGTRAFARFRAMETRSRYGVWWQDNWSLPNVTPSADEPSFVRHTGWLSTLQLNGTHRIPPGAHPFGERWANYYRTLMIEPGRHLDTLMRELREAGGRIEQRGFSSLEEVAALPQPIVFNCTGLGAGALFGDENVLPVRGQLVVLKPQPALNYNLIAGGGFIFPRPDGVVLGGTETADDWRLEPDPADTTRIMAAAQRGFALVP